MKTAEQWLSERCVPEEHSGDQPLWRDWIAAIQLEAYRQGCTDSAKAAISLSICWIPSEVEANILALRDSKRAGDF